MEELHMAASAYYNNSSPEVKKLAQEFFDSMDTDKDEKVSIDEFTDFVKQHDDSVDRSFFAALDRNGDGSLQFEEVLTLIYIIFTGQNGRNMVSFFSHWQLGNYPFVNEMSTVNRTLTVLVHKFLIKKLLKIGQKISYYSNTKMPFSLY